MNISLNPNLEKFIHQKIEEGYYNSASEVVRDALRLLIEKETLFKQQIDKLNQDIALGLTQLAEGKGIEGKNVFDEIKAFLKEITCLPLSFPLPQDRTSLKYGNILQKKILKMPQMFFLKSKRSAIC